MVNIQMWRIFAILFTGLTLLLVNAMTYVESVSKTTPKLCNQTEPWTLGGRDIVAESKGLILLVVLMPMHCDHCHKQLMKFQAIMETLSEIRIVVVAPYDDNPRLIERYREEFPRVAIGMDSMDERIWTKLSGSVHDHLIYDRCGRLANVIRYPKSDMTKFEDILSALKLAMSYAHCGWCQYDPPDLPKSRKHTVATSTSNSPKGKTKIPRIKAVVYPSSTLEISRTSTLEIDHQPSAAPIDAQPNYLQTSTIASVPETASKTSSDYLNSVSSRNHEKSKVIGDELQRQLLTQSREEQIGRHRFRTDRQQQQQQQQHHHKHHHEHHHHQRRIIIRPDKDLPSRHNWRMSKGRTTPSRHFPSQIQENGNHQIEQAREQQKEEEQRILQEQHERQRQHEENEERKRLLEEQRKEQDRERQIQEQQEWQQRLREQHEEQRRRIQEQQQHQEEQRRLQEQQRLKQQDLERRMEERRRLQQEEEQRKKQRTGSELYSDDDDNDDNNEGDGDEHEEELKSHINQQHVVASSSTIRAPFDLRGITPITPSLYDLTDEDDYNYSPAVSKTTTTTVTTERSQIPGTEPPGIWPTPFVFEEQVPCAAFTDEVCFQQKKLLGIDRMNKCCDKGIYLTNLCTPGRCTNAVTELCCMQKFLQSKYKCCLNDSEAINIPGDAFSHCCFHNFVEDDDKCCPAQRAKFHWLTAFEICLPNVRVDLSGLRFSVQHANSDGDPTIGEITTINLNDDRSWDHSCEQGANVLQFPYLPDDLEESNESVENTRRKRYRF